MWRLYVGDVHYLRLCSAEARCCGGHAERSWSYLRVGEWHRTVERQCFVNMGVGGGGSGVLVRFWTVLACSLPLSRGHNGRCAAVDKLNSILNVWTSEIFWSDASRIETPRSSPRC